MDSSKQGGNTRCGRGHTRLSCCNQSARVALVDSCRSKHLPVRGGAPVQVIGDSLRLGEWAQSQFQPCHRATSLFRLGFDLQEKPAREKGDSDEPADTCLRCFYRSRCRSWGAGREPCKPLPRHVESPPRMTMYSPRALCMPSPWLASMRPFSRMNRLTQRPSRLPSNLGPVIRRPAAMMGLCIPKIPRPRTRF